MNNFVFTLHKLIGKDSRWRHLRNECELLTQKLNFKSYYCISIAFKSHNIPTLLVYDLSFLIFGKGKKILIEKLSLITSYFI